MELEKSLAGERLLAWLERGLLHFDGPHPTVGIVIVGWDAERTQAAVRAVDDWVREKSVALQSATLVCNRPLSITVSPAWTIVAGSNRAGEFSGYDEGIVQGEKRGTPAVWALINDRYDSYGAPNLDAAYRPVLQIVAEQPVIVGHVDQHHGRLHKHGPPLPMYVRTNFMLISADSLAAALPFARNSLDEADTLFPAAWPHAGQCESELFDDGYLRDLAGWLTGRGRTAKTSWYRATDDPDDTPFLRAKAVSIVNEHLLSLSLLEKGITPVDTRRVMRSAALIKSPAKLRTEIAAWGTSDISYDARRLRISSILRAAGARLRPSSGGPA